MEDNFHVSLPVKTVHLSFKNTNFNLNLHSFIVNGIYVLCALHAIALPSIRHSIYNLRLFIFHFILLCLFRSKRRKVLVAFWNVRQVSSTLYGLGYEWLRLNLTNDQYLCHPSILSIPNSPNSIVYFSLSCLYIEHWTYGLAHGRMAHSSISHFNILLWCSILIISISMNILYTIFLVW